MEVEKLRKVDLGTRRVAKNFLGKASRRKNWELRVKKLNLKELLYLFQYWLNCGICEKWLETKKRVVEMTSVSSGCANRTTRKQKKSIVSLLPKPIVVLDWDCQKDCCTERGIWLFQKVMFYFVGCWNERNCRKILKPQLKKVGCLSGIVENRRFLVKCFWLSKILDGNN